MKETICLQVMNTPTSEEQRPIVSETVEKMSVNTRSAEWCWAAAAESGTVSRRAKHGHYILKLYRHRHTWFSLSRSEMDLSDVVFLRMVSLVVMVTQKVQINSSTIANSKAVANRHANEPLREIYFCLSAKCSPAAPHLSVRLICSSSLSILNQLYNLYSSRVFNSSINL